MTHSRKYVHVTIISASDDKPVGGREINTAERFEIAWHWKFSSKVKFNEKLVLVSATLIYIEKSVGGWTKLKRPRGECSAIFGYQRACFLKKCYVFFDLTERKMLVAEQYTRVVLKSWISLFLMRVMSRICDVCWLFFGLWLFLVSAFRYVRDVHVCILCVICKNKKKDKVSWK